MTDKLNRQEGQWASTVKERFGIPDPQEVMKEVDRIIEAHLPSDTTPH